jgi:hypothetical protein
MEPAQHRRANCLCRFATFPSGLAVPKADSLLKKLCREHAGPEAFDQLYRSLPDPWSTTAD